MNTPTNAARGARAPVYARASRRAAAVGRWLNAGATPDAALYVVLAYAAYRIFFDLLIFNAMAVPEFDFFEFRKVAAAFSRLELPLNFKRAPLYPAFMALWPFRFAGADRLLQGGEVASLLAGAGTLLLTYRWCRPFCGRAAALVAVIVGSSWLYPQLTAQPLCEMTLLFFVVATAAAGRGSAWAYVAAACAAATRYEGIALIPLALAADFRLWRRRPRLFLYAVLALLPVAAWLALGVIRTSSPNPYVRLMGLLTPTGPAFLNTAAEVLFPPWAGYLNVAAWAFAGLSLLGVGYAAARGAPGVRFYASFAVVYVLIHIAYPFNFDRFVLLLFPLLALGVVAGGRLVAAGVGRLVRGARGWNAAAAVLVAAWAAATLGALWSRRAEGAVVFGVPMIAAVFFTAAALGATAGGGSFREGRRFFGAAATLAVVTMYVFAQTRVWAAQWETFRWRGAAVRAATVWLARVAPPGSTVCTVWPSLVKFYGTAAALAPVTPAEVERRSRRVPFLPEVAGRATYVLYDTLSGATSPVPDYHAGLQGSVLLAPFATGADVGRYRFIGAVHAPGEYALIYRLEAEPPDWQAPVLEPTDGVPGTLIEPDVSRVK